MRVVSNAGPLIALSRIEQLAILPALYGEILVPRAVSSELSSPTRVRAGAHLPSKADWLRVKPVSDRTAVMLLRERLDAGESEAIVLALQLDADLLLMDEARGRRIAASHGLTLTGTLGTLILAKKHRLIEQVAPLLEELRDEGFRMSEDLYREALRQAGER